MKRLVLVVLALALVFGLMTGCSKDEQASTDSRAAVEEKTVYRIKGGHANPATHPYHIGLEKFGELLEEKKRWTDHS